jgi:hypothetical protein
MRPPCVALARRPQLTRLGQLNAPRSGRRLPAAPG